MILHNPRVFYFQRLDPTGAGRRLLDLYTSFDGAKRLGSGKTNQYSAISARVLCSA